MASKIKEGLKKGIKKAAEFGLAMNPVTGPAVQGMKGLKGLSCSKRGGKMVGGECVMDVHGGKDPAQKGIRRGKKKHPGASDWYPEDEPSRTAEKAPDEQMPNRYKKKKSSILI